MIRSMTAFARAETEHSWGSLQLELRSVNNRYLDVSPRLPEELRSLEPIIRERTGARIGRGKLDCTFRMSYLANGQDAFSINLNLAKQVVRAVEKVKPLLDGASEVTPMDVLRWPGVIQPSGPDIEAVREAALTLLDAALDDLVEMRTREGEKIRKMILQRCSETESIVAALRRRVPMLLEESRQKLWTRLEELKSQLDQGRLEQEMLFLAQKMDVSEELDRLDAHLGEVRRILDVEEPVGRRLDFLMQELNREANTLGSKSSAAETTRASVDLKVLIEQMREQIQNIE
jgi:uncharacterized protein (TIGR00255 family)